MSLLTRRTGYRDVFAVAEFRAVFAAHVLSILGEVLAGIALSVLVYRLTGSPLLSALTFALGLLPYALGGTVLASVADRFPARRVLVACDLLCAAAAVGLAVPGTPVVVLLVLRAAMAAVAPVFTGTRAATLADILGPGDGYVLGRSLIRLVAQGGQLVGFGAGGLLLTMLSPRAVLAVTTATFLCSALILRAGTRRRPARGGTGPLLAGSLRGMRRLLGDRRIRGLLVLAWVPPAFVVVSEALLTPYAAGIGAGPVGLGLLMCGMPVGAVLAETLTGALLGPRGRDRLVRPVALWACLPALAYALHPSLPLALACQVLTGLGIAYGLGLDRRFVAAAPEELRGVALTLQTAGLMTAQGLGMALAGAAAEVLPVPTVVAGGGLVGLCAVAAALRYARPALRHDLGS
ncbi:MFS transporter [Actinocatenispora rupis]|uniref:MFS transporter n=1 Tax=Actinocatenispora rupis TaxID=519421 RepID=A0A8J3JG14_9ACTN|nr:MFS transporter [Actinocatenispora rupis]GID15732.1 MFS transporter [Actinocatenispora rupis]